MVNGLKIWMNRAHIRTNDDDILYIINTIHIFCFSPHLVLMSTMKKTIYVLAEKRKNLDEAHLCGLIKIRI